MTSSAKQTKGKSKSRAEKSKSLALDRPASAADESERKAALPPIPHPEWVIGGTLVFAGWILIAYINRWHLGAPVFFLCLGWVAILLVGKFLWTAGLSAAEGRDDDEGFVVTTTRREELVREKKTLLKAIKEVEFDHQLGKMSDRDAEEITRFYRARAIEIIKKLERIDRGEEAADGELTVQEKIEREVRARMTVLGSTAKGSRQAEAKKEKLEAKKARKAGKAGGQSEEPEKPQGEELVGETELESSDEGAEKNEHEHEHDNEHENDNENDNENEDPDTAREASS